jgi:hypothetical protein
MGGGKPGISQFPLDYLRKLKIAEESSMPNMNPKNYKYLKIYIFFYPTYSTAITKTVLSG